MKNLIKPMIMKKLLISIFLLGCCLAAGAQNMYDAINLSEVNYFGTARSMALGNAVTAVGGDLGTVNINPAGSAVAGYSQFTISPGITISSTSAGYVGNGVDQHSSSISKSRKITMPNLGTMLNFETGKKYGLKSYAFGAIINHTNNFLNSFDVATQCSKTSRFAEFAAASNGLSTRDLGSYDAFYDTDINWDLLTAYQANLFSDYGTDGLYAGNSEAIAPGLDYHYIPGAMTQRSHVERSGIKRDVIVNFAGNISDRIFFGVNLGSVTSSYNYSELYREEPLQPDLFGLTFVKDGQNVETNYLRGSMRYAYAADYTGIYGKIGVIALPFRFLRIGAAIKTPTLYTVNEAWQYEASSSYSNSYFNGSATSPLGNYTYDLVSPWEANFGIAMTLGARLLLSYDYEMTDYSSMRFENSPSSDFGFNPFNVQNETMSRFCGVSNSHRFGVELRLIPSLSLRYGYTNTSSPERVYTDEYGNYVDANEFSRYYDDFQSGRVLLYSPRYVNSGRHSHSFGIGYASNGSFFMDFAIRKTTYTAETYLPYYDYTNYDKNGQQVNTPSPQISYIRRPVNAILTFGWRF